jgi:hypothetical protein
MPANREALTRITGWWSPHPADGRHVPVVTREHFERLETALRDCVEHPMDSSDNLKARIRARRILERGTPGPSWGTAAPEGTEGANAR